MNRISLAATSDRHRPAIDENPWLSDRRPVDRAAVQRAARDLLAMLGADLETEGLHETPRRMADAYSELLTPEPFSLTTFPNDEGYDELVLVRDIPFQSLCMHPCCRFMAWLTSYTSRPSVSSASPSWHGSWSCSRGISQLQERLTMQIAACLHAQLQPKGVGVVLEASTRACRCAGCRSPVPRP